MSESIRAGVVGVGHMGDHHARVYRELSDVRLVGVADADADTAAAVASTYETDTMGTEALLDTVDAISIAVPTEYHYDVVTAALEAGCDVFVEKPFVEDPERGRELIRLADDHGAVLQVGHVERFNPAVRALDDVLVDADTFGVAARRQGPPTDREFTETVVMDLMVHDIDILRSLTDGTLESVSAAGTADDRHVVALLEFDDGIVGSLTASRVTQKRIRDLSVSTPEFQVEVDYLDQSVKIHRRSLPEYVSQDGEVRYRKESVVERPTVSNGEPLEKELASFAEAVRTRTEPPVTGHDGLRAVEIAKRIEAAMDVHRRPELTP